jgi:hypothetical protein
VGTDALPDTDTDRPGLVDQGLDRVRRNADAGFRRADEQQVVDVLVARIHHHGSHGVVGVQEGRGQQRAATADRADPTRIRPDEFRKVADVVVGRRVDQRPGGGIGVDRREAEVADVVRAAVLVQQDIPVGPGNGAAVEIVDHGLAVFLAIGPVLVALGREFLDRGLGQQQLLVRVGAADFGDVAVHGLAASPGFVPVEADAPDVFGGTWIVQDGARPVGDQVAVVVPGDDLPVPIPVLA